MRLTADDSESTSPTAWADSVCTSLSTWRSSITAISDVSGETLTPESLKESLGEATTATETMVDELQQLGPPDLDSGDALKQQLDASASEIAASFDTLKQGAEEAADSSSPTDFLQALAGLAPQFEALLDAISTTVDDLQSADVAGDVQHELQEAFANTSSCQELRSES